MAWILIAFIMWLFATNKFQDWTALFSKSSGTAKASASPSSSVIPDLPDLGSIL